MESVRTRVLRDRWDVEPRLAELRLTRVGLLKIAAQAFGDRGNATPFHAANAAGTYAYQTGTWALRHEYVGNEDWKVDRTHGVEAIYNPTTKTRIVFSNVDICRNDQHEPKPRSVKGAGAERSCAGNLFGDLPAYAPRQDDREPTFYLMMDEAGASELSRPVVKGGTFSAFVERIYLFGEEDDDLTGGRLSLDDGDVVDNFDPQVARK